MIICQRFQKLLVERMMLGRSGRMWSAFTVGLGSASEEELGPASSLSDVKEISGDGYARLAGTWHLTVEELFAGLILEGGAGGIAGWVNLSDPDWDTARNIFVAGTLDGSANQLCMVVPLDPARTLAKNDSLIVTDGFIPLRLEVPTSGGSGF